MRTAAPDTPGHRLRRLVDAHWSREQGGIRGLAAAMGVSAETVYAWFRGDSEPSMDHLTRLAARLGVSRYQIVATMDGAGQVFRRGDAELAEMVDDLVEAALDARGVPRRRPDGATSPSLGRQP